MKISKTNIKLLKMFLFTFGNCYPRVLGCCDLFLASRVEVYPKQKSACLPTTFLPSFSPFSLLFPSHPSFFLSIIEFNEQIHWIFKSCIVAVLQHYVYVRITVSDWNTCMGLSLLLLPSIPTELQKDLDLSWKKNTTISLLPFLLCWNNV